MNPTVASRLVRGWVGVYTHGLPPSVRVARSDEIESDLWSQREEAGSADRSDSELGLEILARLLLGAPADITWRLDHERLAGEGVHKSRTLGTWIVALLAIVGGLSLSLGLALWVVMILSNPGMQFMDLANMPGGALAGIAATIAVSLSLGGLGLLLLERTDSPIALVAEIGCLGGLLSQLGAWDAALLLSISSAIVALHLARIHAIHWSLALIHTATAPGVALMFAAYSNTSLLGVAMITTLFYFLTWSAIGVELLAGLPQMRPATRPPR